MNLGSITKSKYMLKETVNHIAPTDLQDVFLLVQEFDTVGMPEISSNYTNLLEDQKGIRGRKNHPHKLDSLK